MKKYCLIITIILLASIGGFLFFYINSTPAWNVVLISIDTLRADHLGCYGYNKNISPNIDHLAQTGIQFANAYSHCPLTLPSHTSLLTGLPPNVHGVRDNAFFMLDKNIPTLATILQQKGYQTAAVVSGSTLVHTKGLAKGFQIYDDLFEKAEGNYLAERIAESSIQKAFHILQNFNSQKPYFLWLHLFDPHAEYNPPNPFEKSYDGEIAYTDQCLEPFFKEVCKDNTIVVLVADHGESLGEHGEASHGYLLYQSTLHVPCIFWASKLLKPRIEKNEFRLMDVMPTLLSLIGISKKNYNTLGMDISQNLINNTEWKPKACYAESYYAHHAFGWSVLRCWIEDKKKYIDSKQGEVYNLTRDTNEIHNLLTIPNETENATIFAKLCKQKLSNLSHSHAWTNENSDDLEKLQSLSYIGSAPKTENFDNLPDTMSMVCYISLFSSAQTALNNGHFEQAKLLLLQLLKADPNNVSGWSLLGKTYTKLQEWDNAILAYNHYMQLRPQLLSTKKSLLDVYLQRGDFDVAEKLAKKILRREGEVDAMVLSRMAYIELHKQKWLEAQKYATRATLCDANLPSAWFYLGTALQEQKKYAQAITAWEKATQLRNDWSEVYYLWGIAQLSQNNINIAKQIFQLGLQRAKNQDQWTNKIKQQLLLMQKMKKD